MRTGGATGHILALGLLGLGFECIPATPSFGSRVPEPKAPVYANAPHGPARRLHVSFLRLRGGTRSQRGMGTRFARTDARDGSARENPEEEVPQTFSPDIHHSGRSAKALEGVPSDDGHNGLITCLEYKRGFVYTGSVDRTVRVWDAGTGECLQVLQRSGEGEDVGPGCVTSIVVSDRALWAGMSTGALNIWCLQSFQWQGQVGAYWDDFTKQGQFHPGSIDALLYLPPLRRAWGAVEGPGRVPRDAQASGATQVAGTGPGAKREETTCAISEESTRKAPGRGIVMVESERDGSTADDGGTGVPGEGDWLNAEDQVTVLSR